MEYQGEVDVGKEKKCMTEYEKLIKPEHIRAAAREIISKMSSSKNNGSVKKKAGAKPQIYVFYEGTYIGARELRREACKYVGYEPDDHDMNGKGGIKSLSIFWKRFPEFKLIDLKEEKLKDFKWQNEIQNANRSKQPQLIVSNAMVKYKRDKTMAIGALEKAEYRCEYDKDHESFISRKTNKPYMEAHHLIPMEFQHRFIDSIDREENIICLCSRCHNEIHYGVDREIIIKKLFKQRKETLVKAGVDITIDTLLEMYGFIDGD